MRVMLKVKDFISLKTITKNFVFKVEKIVVKLV